MAKRLTLNDFTDNLVSVPIFKSGQFGMDIVIRDYMDDKEWRRWLAVSQTRELKQMMSKYRSEHGSSGIREAIIDFLVANGINVKDGQ